MIELKDLILKEIEIAHSEIARFDNNGLKVKEWCLGVRAALLAYGIQHRELLYRRCSFHYNNQFLTCRVNVSPVSIAILLAVQTPGRNVDVRRSSEKNINSTFIFLLLESETLAHFGTSYQRFSDSSIFTYFYLILAAFAYACMVFVYVLHSVIDDSAVNEWVIRVLVALIVGGMLSLIVGFVRSEIAKNQSK